MIKQRKTLWNKLEQKGKSKTSNNDNTTRGNKLKSTGEKRKIKKIPRQGKTIQTKKDIPKQRKKIQTAVWGRWYEDIPTTGFKGSKTILVQNMATKRTLQKAEWISNTGKELGELEEGSKAKVHINSLRVTKKKCQTGKHQAMIAYIDSGLKKFTSIHNWLAIEMNWFLQEADVPE